MNLTKSLLIATAVAAFSFTSAMANHHMAGAIKVAETAKGKVLTNAHGMTLYTFAKDKPGKSNCNGGCATKWPPMAATTKSKDEGNFTVIKRDDKSTQWAHKNMPLYTWIKDKKAGDVTGDGVKGVWHLARP
jgi:predicted lipoprotein with Yx(FWY)xxD motif